MDFTLKTYKKLLDVLLAQGYTFLSFVDYLKFAKSQKLTEKSKIIILRHDVEKKYEQALIFAKIQNQLGIQGTYFFRLLPKCFKSEVVQKIADLGHEIAYHYDDLAQCKGNYQQAILRFQKNLNTLRAIAPVQTICMDGSPLSKYDNKGLWRREDASTALSMTEKRGDGETERLGERAKERRGEGESFSKDSQLITGHPSLDNLKSYKDFGIIGEPYFDLDFNDVFYLTDTGRRWDGWKTSVRDKVSQQETWIQQGLVYHSTEDIIQSAEHGILPSKIMLTFHPQRWTNNPFHWINELVLQVAKNQVKKFVVKENSSQ